MELEGILKEVFLEWCWIAYYKRMSYSLFLSKWEFLPQSAQFGLIVEYAEDVLGFEIFIKKYGRWFIGLTTKEFYNGEEKSRQEAQIKAVEKLNEIINK